MKHGYTVSQLARAAGVSASTVRYYDRTHLLSPAARTESNYRLYESSALDTLNFIRAAQAIGFTLQDVSALLALRERKGSACKQVQGMIEARLNDLDRRLKKLTDLRQVLWSSLGQCRRVERSGRCAVIETLKVHSAPPPSEAH